MPNLIEEKEGQDDNTTVEEADSNERKNDDQIRQRRGILATRNNHDQKHSHTPSSQTNTTASNHSQQQQQQHRSPQQPQLQSQHQQRVSSDSEGITFDHIFLGVFLLAVSIATIYFIAQQLTDKVIVPYFFSDDHDHHSHNPFQHFPQYHPAQQQQQQSPIGLSLQIPLTLAYKGGTRDISYSKNVVCTRCGGHGGEPGHPPQQCSTCQGTGVVTQHIRMGMMTFQQQAHCNVCGGSGKLLGHPCKLCGGHGKHQEYHTKSINISRGIQSGSVVTLEGEGHQSYNQRAGDVQITIHLYDDSRFKREGDDLHTTIKLSLRESLLGFHHRIPHMDGHIIEVNRKNSITTPDSILEIKGEGMIRETKSIYQHKITSSYTWWRTIISSMGLGSSLSDNNETNPSTFTGNLYIRFEIEFPTYLTEKQKSSLLGLGLL